MVVILDNIRSVYNVGSIFRTADAAGVEKIYLCGITPTPVDRFGAAKKQFIKVSLGAEKTVAWEKSASAAKVVKKLQSSGYRVYAVELMKGALPYYRLRKQIRFRQKAAFIFGNEVRGLSPSLLKSADKVIFLPMKGKKESLNVAVTAGIILFNIQYQYEDRVK